MNRNINETMKFKPAKEEKQTAREIITCVYDALKERGYDPINQIVGYIMSGDPTYITSHKNARYLIRRLESDELLEEVIGFYLKSIDAQQADGEK